MKFRELTEKEYESFCNKSSQKNFTQTLSMVERYKKENVEYYLVGVVEDKKVLAATLLIASNRKFLGQKSFNTLQGPIMDYKNKDLLSFFTNEIKKFVKSKKGYEVIIDPYIISEPRDTDGNVIEGENNLDVKNNLIKLGYKYIGEGSQVKWVYCLDINNMSEDEIFKTFKSSVRNNINKTLNKFMLDVRKLEYDELDQFKKITLDTCQRRGFGDKSLEYYQNMYEVFKDDVAFYICELNLNQYIEKLNDDIKFNEEKINELSDSSSNRNKKKVMQNEIDINKRKIEEIEKLKEEKGEILPLSAAMFMLYGDEIIYLFSGSYDEYMKFFGQYRLQWEIIKYACKNTYRRHNFYGIKDLFNPNGKDYGVYEFKKGFNGYVEELLGTFILPTSFIGIIKNKIKK